MVDIPGNSTTTRTISVGGTTSDVLEILGDHDWFQISLNAGQSISVALDGITLEDSYLRIYNSSGQLLYEHDDISPGVNRDSLLAFTAGYTGDYYIDVGAFDDGYTGSYQLSVSAYSPPPVGTIEQIADQLVNGYWGGDDHHFNVTQGGTITVNITALTAAGKTLAVAALQTWTDIIGVNFVQVTSGAQITFDDNQEGAFSDGTWANGIISSSFVNVSTQWLTDYGTGLNTYSFQTYIHEIGHALGLGHAGNYNGDARFPFDASFYNDSWTNSVMSYFSQTESGYFADRGFSEAIVVTPMMADIIAMSTLYGLSQSTRLGNSTYGFNSNAGSSYNAALYPDVAYTIYDSGGVDTLDYSGFNYNQTINLNPEAYSNVGGKVGNVTIARGVVIENAKGGSGNDTIIGSAANNVLSGGAGEDTVSYEAAAAGVTVNLSIVAQQNTVGAGSDTLSGFERLLGSAFNDTLTGSSTTLWIFAGDGNDVIISTGTGEHRLYGEGGDDRFVGGQGDDWFTGGDGFDTVDYSGATGSINAATNDGPSNTGTAGFDTMGVEKIIGSNFNDTLWAFYVGHEVWGGAGNDTLRGSALGASQLYGGTGNDIFEVRHAANQVIEASGEGIDLVMAEANFTLSANVENLTLVQPVYDPYAGAGLQPPPFDDFYGTGNNLANVITGNRGDNILSGLAGNDTLTGGEGNDALDGGADADMMAGGLGNDSYVVDNAGDVVTENSGQGTDIAHTSISWVLSGNLENLTLTGSAAINGTGNSLDNVITGNAAANVLDGGAGSDVLTGGAGDDWIVYDAADNAAQVTGGTGTDTLVVSGVAPPMSFNLVAQGFELAEVSQSDSGSNSWSTIVSTYNAAWQLTAQDLTFDNGTRTLTMVDVSNGEAWSQRWVNFDAEGRFLSEDRHYDGGGHTWTVVDADNSQSWSRTWLNYDAQGRLTSQDLHFDDGSRTWTSVDVDDSQAWAQQWNNFDAQGRLTSQDLHYDDGTRVFTNIDAANGESWSQEWLHFNAQGDLYAKVIAWDDGSTSAILI